MKKNRSWPFMLAALVIVAGFAFVGGVILKPKPGIQDTTLSEGFKAIAELSVEEYYFTDIAKMDDSLNALGKDLPFTNKEILLTYKGSAKAGIRNFEDVDVSVDEGARKVIVKTPKVEVLDVNIDDSSVEIYDESSGLFNPVKAGDSTKLLADKQSEAKDEAIEAGILDRAKTRAEEILKSHVEGVLSGTQQEGYTIEVQWVG